jgi:hypothetical protein
MDKEISLTVKLITRDFYQYITVYLLRKWYTWIVIVMAASVICTAILKGPSKVQLFSWVFVLAIIIMIVLILVQGKKLKNNKKQTEEKRYSFSREQIVLESASVNVTMRWSMITHYILRKRTIYLFVSEIEAHIIPLESLAIEDRHRLKQLIRLHVHKQRMSGIAIVFISLAVFLVGVGILQALSR